MNDQSQCPQTSKPKSLSFHRTPLLLWCVQSLVLWYYQCPLFFLRKTKLRSNCNHDFKSFYSESYINPILHGLLEIRYHMGGSKRSPPLKSIKSNKTRLKCMFWQKQIIFTPNFGIRKLISSIFDPKKGPMQNAFLHV